MYQAGDTMPEEPAIPAPGTLVYVRLNNRLGRVMGESASPGYENATEPVLRIRMVDDGAEVEHGLSAIAVSADDGAENDEKPASDVEKAPENAEKEPENMEKVEISARKRPSRA